MRVLVYGPGMIGSLIAGRLGHNGHDVDIVGRGARLDEIRERGIRLRNMRSSEEIVAEVGAADALDPGAAYDWILVTVRADQVDSVLPAVASSSGTPNVMIMTNRALGYTPWAQSVGPDRLTAGFPGAGGYVEDGVVHYAMAPSLVQPTTIGELDGRRSERLLSLCSELEQAGIPTVVHRDIDAWQKYHVAWIGAFVLGGLVADNDPDELVANKSLRKLVVLAVRDGLSVLGALGVERTPGNLRVWTHLPVSWVAFFLKRIAGNESIRMSMIKSGDNKLREARVMNDEMKQLAERAGVATPNLDALAERAFRGRTG